MPKKFLYNCAMEPYIERATILFTNLQQQLLDELKALDSDASITEDSWQRSEGGGGISKVIKGSVIEQGGVNYSKVYGATLPPTATLKRPELAAKDFTALGISSVLHPYNPYVPTAHMNLRLFIVGANSTNPLWWFGGGFDLTPYYPFVEDCIYWHQNAYQACKPYGDNVYAEYKKLCDEYFYLKHRSEARGIGGIFFDDLNQWPFATCFDFVKNVGEVFIKSYTHIVAKRKEHAFTAEERKFQNLRRGRYVEFNLLYDRGTLFGLQSNGRVESILMSLPPTVKWEYGYKVLAGSKEASLTEWFLQPKDWLNVQLTNC